MFVSQRLFKCMVQCTGIDYLFVLTRRINVSYIVVLLCYSFQRRLSITFLLLLVQENTEFTKCEWRCYVLIRHTI